jgi:hypothetical protein
LEVRRDDAMAILELEIAQGSYCPADACLDRGSIAWLHQTTSFRLLLTNRSMNLIAGRRKSKRKLNVSIRIRADGGAGSGGNGRGAGP